MTTTPTQGEFPPHEAVFSTRGVASSAYPYATQAALEILARGGSAVDAAIGAGAVLTVLMPTAGALGGDCFFQVSGPDGSISAVNGSGAAPAGATFDRYQEIGEIPDTGWLASSVPGMVDGWRVAHERWGHLEWGTLFEAAIRYADEGFPVSPSLSQRFANQADRLRAFPETARIFFPSGPGPQPGEMLHQPDLANTLLTLADEGPECFYYGKIGAAIAESSARNGGVMTADDLASHTTPTPRSLRIPYREAYVHGQPPVSQGIVLLMALGALDEFDLADHGPGSANTVHLQVEAIKQGFADRMQHLGDPDQVDVPVERMISARESKRRASRIDLHSRSDALLPSSSPDTTSLVTADSEGRVVAYIHSLYAGSGVTAHGTGIMMNNRLQGFDLDPNSPNCLAPGKRPVHTLNTAIVTRGDDIYAICTPGANLQVQHNLQVITNLIDFKLDMQEAIDAPRWSMGDQMRIGDDELLLESRFGEDVLEDLTGRGHNVRTRPGWAVGGGIQVAHVNRHTGILSAARDPRRASNLASGL
ncbi:MAG: gamma-glutamyltransferase family protein [Chloroflexota bacterium]